MDNTVRVFGMWDLEDDEVAKAAVDILNIACGFYSLKYLVRVFRFLPDGREAS